MNVEDLADSAALTRLIAERATVARGGASVAFAAHGRVAAASVGDARARERWPLGCLAKLLTATLVRRAAARGRVALDDSIAPLLDADGGVLHAVTARHLLEHTHGLDDSLLDPPRYEHGLVARAELVRRIGALERFAEPGAAYSYGHGGAWLAAVLLERIHGRSFASLVVKELLEPLGIDGASRATGAPLCAASGTGLVLTAAQLVRFGSYALAHENALGEEPIKPLPGWHPLERGVCLGWKYAGSGWFGHQSVWPRASSFLRVHPASGLALAVVTSDEAAPLVAMRVFGSYFPELFQMPGRALPERTEDALGAGGIYEQAAREIAISREHDGVRAEIWQRGAHGARHGAPGRVALVPAGRVYFGRPAREHLPYAELVAGGGGARWLWNGRCLLRPRVTRHAATRR